MDCGRMRIGVAGASGFIGEWLLRKSLETYDIVRLERDGKYRFRIPSRMGFDDCDIIVYLAGVNRADPDAILCGNVLPLHSLLSSLRDSERTKTVIFASSLQVYGHSKSRMRFQEVNAIQPETVYGLSKSMAERMVQLHCQAGHCRGIVLRIANVYGHLCRPYYNSVVATFDRRLRDGLDIRIDGSGLQERDFIYVEDVTEAIMRSIDFSLKARKEFSVYNVCSGVPTPISMLASAMARIYGTDTVIYHEGSASPVNYLIGDPSLSAEELGFVARYDLESGLRAMKAIGDMES